MLSRMVEEYTDRELIVLTDRETNLPGFHVERRHPLRGWWSKLELFSPEFQYRPCLFFDLDTYIRGNIDDLLEEPEDLWLIRDFYQQSRSNSGVMRIPRETQAIWERAQRWDGFNDPRRGDGDYLTTCKHKVMDDMGIVSYKVHCQKRPTGRIVCFHGQPKPHNAPGWAGDVWRQWTR